MIRLLLLAVLAAAGEGAATREKTAAPDDFLDHPLAAPAEPLVEKTAKPRRLETTPSKYPIVEWEEEPEVGLRQTRRVVAPPVEEPAPAARSTTSIAGTGLRPQRPEGVNDWNAIYSFCERGRCTEGEHEDETIVDFDDGRRIIHRYYAHRTLGFHNEMLTIMPDGSSTTLTCSPLIFDLTGKGVRASDRKVRFDIDGDGAPEVIRDFSSGDGVLAFDSDKDGVSGGHGRELFGENTDLDGDGKADGFADGFEALWGLVRRAVKGKVLAQSVVERKLLEAADLKALEKAYGLKIRASGLEKKAVSLSRAGIAEIRLSEEPSHLFHNFDGQGNDVMRRRGADFTRADGTRGAYEDVWFAFAPTSSRRKAPR